MNKKTIKKAAALVAAGVMAVGMTACSGSSSSSGASTYTASYTVMAEDGTYTPIENSQWVDGYSFHRDAYYDGFGGFVDTITVDATLEVDGDSYTLTWETHCGSDDNTLGNYSPIFVFKGSVTESTSTTVTVSAPTEATMTVHSSGQFATNAEMTGYFGTDGFETTSAEADSTYPVLPSGDTLLAALTSGTYSVSGSSLGDFTAD